jgi:DNA-binding NarL/FixJ family response regulator
MGTMSKRIKVVIADDHSLMRTAWAFMLNRHPNFIVISECGTGKEAVDIAKELRPDVIIMDINMPDMDGIEATELISIQSPSTRILGISSHSHPSFMRRMIRKGALGYITKNSPVDELFHALNEVVDGRRYICNEMKQLLVEQEFDDHSTKNALNSLTEREMEIVNFLKAGYSSKEIAKKLLLATKTVEVHRYNVLKKLGLKNSTALVNFVHHHID